MPIFEIQGPDGQTYEVEAPDEQQAAAAFGQSQEPAYRGSFLPFSRDKAGNVSFDSDAGILGAVKRIVMAPERVRQGKLDPMSDEAIQTMADTALMFSPGAPGLRAGVGVAGAPLSKRTPIEPPTAEALKRAASGQYDTARGLGVEYDPKAVSGLASGLQGQLNQEGTLSALAPQTHGILNDLANPPQGAVAAPIQNLEAARRAFGNVRGNFNNTVDQRAAGLAQDGLTGFLEGSDPSSVLAGPASAAAGLYRDARGNYAAAMRSQDLAGVGQAAELRAAAANSGRNVGNSVRSRIASLLLDDSARAGFNPEEVAALEGVVRGTPGRNALRHAGNLLGGGGGLGQALTSAGGAALGGAAGGGFGAAVGAAVPPALGMAAKGTENMLTQRALGNVDKMTRMRSPLAQALQAQAPIAPQMSPAQQAIIRALMLEQMQQQPQ